MELEIAKYIFARVIYILWWRRLGVFHSLDEARYEDGFNEIFAFAYLRASDHKSLVSFRSV